MSVLFVFKGLQQASGIQRPGSYDETYWPAQLRVFSFQLVCVDMPNGLVVIPLSTSVSRLERTIVDNFEVSSWKKRRTHSERASERHGVGGLNWQLLINVTALCSQTVVCDHWRSFGFSFLFRALVVLLCFSLALLLD